MGNPPFAAKNAIVATGGREYVPWLLATVPQAHGNADLCSYFFRCAGRNIGGHGTLGFLATNTVSQGDTRTVGLSPLLADGFRILDATTDESWEGSAAVTVSWLVAGCGKPVASRKPRLNGAIVESIDSRLRAARERPNAEALASMASNFFMGTKVYGKGFILGPKEAEELLAVPENHAVVRPVIGGEDVNTDPLQRAPAYVISFGQLPLREAANWAEVMRLVEERVKPERDAANEATADGAHRKKYWWQHAQPRPELYIAISPLGRCLVTARVSKHLLMSFQPTDRVFSEQLFVFPLEAATPFAILQSRIHEPWARLLSSSMKTDLRYVASDCFETFPFPRPDPRTVLPELEAIGERLYETRARFMVDTDQGLTKTYNALKDPGCTDPRILELRQLHEEMDRAVLAAYGWSDLAVPPYCPSKDAERAALKSFEDAVIDRLFELNAQRAEEERKAGGGASGKGRGGKRARVKDTPPGSAIPAKKPKKKAGAGSGQGTLPGVGDDDG